MLFAVSMYFKTVMIYVLMSLAPFSLLLLLLTLFSIFAGKSDWRLRKSQ